MRSWPWLSASSAPCRPAHALEFLLDEFDVTGVLELVVTAGPIAKAIRTKYQPAATNNKDFVESLRKLLAFNGDQVRSLRQVVTDVDIASGDIARNLGGRR